jgi:transposase
VASLYPKKISGKTYYYLREMARIDGTPKMVSERYLGSAEEIAAAVAARDAASLPERTRHLAFGDVAAVWGVLTRLDVAGVIDEVVGDRRADAGASVGTYLALAALGRLVDPCSKAAFADWWGRTAADRFTRIPTRVLDHRRFWSAMHAVSLKDLTEIERRLALRMIDVFELDVSALALDMTNFATYIDTANPAAPVAQRGKAKQKRSDLRLVGLGLVVTRDGGVPLVSHTYPGNRPDVTQFTVMIDELVARHTALAAAHGAPAEVTVVFDAGQNSTANFDHLAASGLRFVGSVPPSDCPDLLALPARRRTAVDADRFDGLSAYETRRTVYGADRRVVLTHSPTLHTGQSRGFDQTLAKAARRLGELAATLARGKTRRDRAKVQAEVDKICADPWVRRVLTAELTGDTHPTTGSPGRSTPTPAPPSKTRCSANASWSPTATTGRSPTWWPPTAPSPRPNSPSGSSKTPTSCLSARCTTGPSTPSACTPSPASWRCRSRTSCAATPTTKATRCPSASCSTSSPASRKPS